jgi:hypothetical protein
MRFGITPLRISTLALALVLARSAHADTNDRQEQIFEQARVGRGLWLDMRDRIAGLRLRVDEGVDFGANYDDSELHWIRSGLTIKGALPTGGPDRGIAVSFTTAVVNPIVDGSTSFIDLPGTNDDPFDPMLDSAFGVGGRFEVGYGFGVEINAGLSARHEIGAEFKSALTTGGSFAVGYRYSNWLRLRVGVGLGTAIDHANLTASPVFRLRLRPMPGVWLETDGTSGRIEWEVYPQFELTLFGGIDSKRYRLASRGQTVGAGSLELKKSEVGIGVRTRIGRSLRLRIQAAVVLGQHLTVFDDDRQNIDARDTREPSGALRISLEWQVPGPSR